MNWQKVGPIIRYHLFLCLTLLGCLAPWVTPRHFPVNEPPLKTDYHLPLKDEDFMIQRWVTVEQNQQLQSAC